MKISAERVDIAVDCRFSYALTIASLLAVKPSKFFVVRVQPHLDCVVNDDEPLQHFLVQFAFWCVCLLLHVDSIA